MALGFKLSSPTAELKTFSFWRDLLNEFLVTAGLLFFVHAVDAVLNEDDAVPLFDVGFVGGLAVFANIEALGFFGGSHMNPSITILLLCINHISLFKALCYVAVQCGGAICGTGLVYLIINDYGQQTMKPINLADGVSQGQGIVCEMVITFNLCIVALGSADAKRKPRFLTALTTGMAVTMGIVAGGKISGGAMNPMIPFGPAVVTNKWDNHWVYWVGPPIGAVLAALLYNLYTLADRLDRPHHDSSGENGISIDAKMADVKGYDNEAMSNPVDVDSTHTQETFDSKF